MRSLSVLYRQGKLAALSRSEPTPASFGAGTSEFCALDRHQSRYLQFEPAMDISGYELNLPVARFIGWTKNHAMVLSCLSACASSETP